MSTNGTSLAAVAGVCAALAGLTAKYALSTENSLALIKLGENYIPSIFLVSEIFSYYQVSLR